MKPPALPLPMKLLLSALIAFAIALPILGRASADPDAGTAAAPTATVPSSTATVATPMDAPKFDASVPGPTSSGAKEAATPSVDKDPAGFFKLAYGFATSGKYFWLFTLVLMGLVEVTRRPYVLKKLPWLSTAAGAHISAGVTAFVITLTVGGIGTQSLSATVIGAALLHALGAGLGWKGLSAGGDDTKPATA